MEYTADNDLLFKAYFSKFSLIFKISKDMLEGYCGGRGFKRQQE
jgi:hypothetical protein